MKRLTQTSFILAALLTACTVEQTENTDGLLSLCSFEATVSEMPQAKAHIEDGTKIKWDLGDCIGVFGDTDGDAIPFRKNDSGNTFSSSTSVSGTEFYAFYPYSEGVFNPNERKMLTFTLGDENTAGGKSPTIQVPMIAKSNGPSLSFKQTSGILHFSITGTRELISLTLAGNNDEIIGGECLINLYDILPELMITGNGTRELTFTPSSPISLSTSEAYDVYFILPPMTFTGGFSVTIRYSETETVTKKTAKAVSIERAVVKNYTLDIDDAIEEGEDDPLTLERNALIAFYNAMDGPNWKDNTNWCSDKPLDEWFGIETEAEGRVYKLEMRDNGLNGTIPDDITALSNLKNLTIQEGTGIISNWEALFRFKEMRDLSLGVSDRYSEDRDEYASWLVPMSPAMGTMHNLRYLHLSGVKGVIPDELFNLEELRTIHLQWYLTDSSLPSGFGKLKNLETLIIQSAHDRLFGKSLTGPIPEDLYDCKNLQKLDIVDTGLSGELSPKIGNLTKLGEGGFRLCNNELSGPIPAELMNYHFRRPPRSGMPFDLRLNHFSGKIPAEFSEWSDWNFLWGYIVQNSDLDYSDCIPHVPVFEFNSLSGEHYSTELVYDKKLTVFFQWATWCSFSSELIPYLKSLYEKYKDQGLEIISWSDENEDTMRPYVAKYGIPGICFSNDYPYYFGIEMWPTNDFPSMVLFDSDGKMVLHHVGSEPDEIIPFIQKWFGDEPETYESTDYSADGTVHTLQTAFEGAGINLVLMGDAFSDRMIADGTYADVMNRAAEAFFSEEPYSSFRNRFNVKYVDVVSKNDTFRGETALDTWYGDGTLVGGNHDKVYEYACKAFTEEELDDAVMIVMMNRDYYAGTCYMNNLGVGDYGRGPSIAYFPTSSDESTFNGLVSHEAAGHGFAKLADEYSYTGTLPDDEKEGKYLSMTPYGWWKNVDFTSDPAKVKWSQFLGDNLYAGEGLGVFEGACTYAHGAWRPTENSIMNDNTGGFNAPSRYAIWYRIGKLAYGEEWSGSYEDFVAYDAVNRTPADIQRRRARANSVEKPLPPLAPPVIIDRPFHSAR